MVGFLVSAILLTISVSAQLTGAAQAMAGDSALPNTGAHARLVVPAQHTITGRVYAGNTGVEPPGSTPIQGVPVSLYCSYNHAVQGALLRSTTTDDQGFYGLEVHDNDGCEFYNIIETDPTGYSSDGATTVDGTVIDANWIEYVVPLEGKALTGNKFWDRRRVTDTPTSTHTATPTDTPVSHTPTNTQVPNTPTPTATYVADTPTPTPSATAPLPSGCQELLINGDFETDDLLQWGRDGAVEMGPGRNSDHGVWLGGTDNAGGELWQGVRVPAGASLVRLAFWWLVESEVEQPGDALEVIVQYGGGQADHLRTLQATVPFGQWQEEAVDLTAFAGREIAVTFLVHTDGEVPATFGLDDVTLQACGGRPAPTLTPTTTTSIPEGSTWEFSGRAENEAGEPLSTGFAWAHGH